MADIVNVIESFLHDVDQGEVEFEELNNVMGYNELKQLVNLAKQATGLQVGSVVRIVQTLDTPINGKLPDSILGESVKIIKLVEDEVWVEFNGEELLVLDGEYEII